MAMVYAEREYHMDYSSEGYILSKMATTPHSSLVFLADSTQRMCVLAIVINIWVGMACYEISLASR